MLFSKCLRAKIYYNMNGHFDPQGCQTLLLKESELFFYLWAPGLFVQWLIYQKSVGKQHLSSLNETLRLSKVKDPLSKGFCYY